MAVKAPSSNHWTTKELPRLYYFIYPGFNPWVRKMAWRRERLPTPVFWSGQFHGLYSAWGQKELDTTEQLSLSLYYFIYLFFGWAVWHVGS